MVEETTKKDTITIKKNSIWKYSTFFLFAVIVIGGIIIFAGNKPSGTGKVVNNPAEYVEISVGNDAFIGDQNAPVTIIEFTDFQCPFCSRHYSETYTKIKANYIDTGKVLYAVKDFPLTNIHPMALPSALAAECVKEQGGNEAYFEYHDKLFENQQSLSDSNLKLWAKEMGYNIDDCLDSEKYLDEISEDFREGSGAGVQGTPASFINGQFVSGAQPYSVFEEIIESYL